MAQTITSSTVVNTPRGVLRDISNNGPFLDASESSPSYCDSWTPSKVVTVSDSFQNELETLPTLVLPCSEEAAHLHRPVTSPESPWIPTHAQNLVPAPKCDGSVQLVSPRLRSPLRQIHNVAISTEELHNPIMGLAESYKSPVDVYTPVVQIMNRRTKAGSDNDLDILRSCSPVEHIDVATVWTHLSIGTAELIFEMNRVITSCLEELLANQLHDLDAAARMEHSPFKANLSSELKDTHPIIFSLNALIDRMVKEMRFNCDYHTGFHSAEAFLELLMLYFISRNSIDEIESSSIMDAVINIGLRPGSEPDSGIVPPAVAHVVPRLDFLFFKGLDVMPREGTPIEIVPEYRRGVFDKANDYYSDISYVIESLPNWLVWDDDLRGWKGRVPLYSECRGMSGPFGEVVYGGRAGPYAVINLLRLEVKAVLIERHSSTPVCLKRTVRSRLTLKVVPWYAHDSCHASPDSLAAHKHPQLKGLESLASRDNDGLPLPYSKATCSPSLLRKVVDGRFGSVSRKLDFASLAQQDLQVYHTSGAGRDLDTLYHSADRLNAWRERLTPPQNESRPPLDGGSNVWFSDDDFNSPGPSGPYSIYDRLTTGQALRHDGGARRLNIYPSSESRPSRRNRNDRSSSDKSGGADIADRDYRRNTNPQKRTRSHATAITRRTVSKEDSYRDWEGQTDNGDIHWQDPDEFGSEFFSLHERHERRQSLQNASPELFGLAQGLHEHTTPTTADRHHQTTYDERLSPVPLSRLRDAALASPVMNIPRESSFSYGMGDVMSRGIAHDRQDVPVRGVGRQKVTDAHLDDIEINTRRKKHSRLDSGCYADDFSKSETGSDTLPYQDDDRTIPDRFPVETESMSNGPLRSLASRTVTAHVHDTFQPVATAKHTAGPISWQQKLEDMAADPNAQREQALLWDLLSRKNDADRRRAQLSKLEMEEERGLWEVMKWEAKQKEGKGVSEETQGLESDGELEGVSSVGEEEEEEEQGEGDDDEEMVGSWNFGC